jgi:hypothetical protein
VILLTPFHSQNRLADEGVTFPGFGMLAFYQGFYFQVL